MSPEQIQPEQNYPDQSDLDQPLPERPKYQFQVETGEFAKDYHSFDEFRTYCDDSEVSHKEAMKAESNLEYYYTPERMARLGKLSQNIFNDLEKYSLKGEPFDPNLVLIKTKPEQSAHGDLMGVADTESRQAHIELWAGAIADTSRDYWRETPIDENKLAGAFIHESLHLYSARVRRIEKDGQEELRRGGLMIIRDGVSLWDWMDEAVIAEMSDVLYKKHMGGEPVGQYKFNQNQFGNMCQALAQKIEGVSADQIKESFRSACFGQGDLMPLRHLIDPPYDSLLDFILATDAPLSLSVTTDMATKICDRLWSDLSQNKKTGFEENLIKDNSDRMSMNRQLKKLSEKLFREYNLEGFGLIVDQISDLWNASPTLQVLAPETIGVIERMKKIKVISSSAKRELNYLINYLYNESAFTSIGDNHPDLMPQIEGIIQATPDATGKVDKQPFSVLSQKYLETIGY